MSDLKKTTTSEHQSSQTDTLFAEPLGQVTRFCFDKNVTEVFPDMIKRSVPGYSAILSMIGDIAGQYAQPNSRCYDLGCSLGAATLAMRHSIKADCCKIIAVDNSQAMIDQCKEKINTDSKDLPVELHCADIESFPVEKASIVVLNFTLQFIDLKQRQALLKKIYDGLLPGGVLILSEKVHFDTQTHEQLMIELHHNFKRLNGYSDLEISQKRTALENVLVSDSIETHRQRLNHCGFSSADVWFQCFNFCSLLAIK